MPGKHVHVVFDVPEAKTTAEQFRQATFHGSPVEWWRVAHRYSLCPITPMRKIMPHCWLCLASMKNCGISTINVIVTGS